MNNSMKGRGEGGTFVLCCGRRLRSFFVTQVRLFDLLPERRLVSETNVDPCKTTDERARAGEGGKRERREPEAFKLCCERKEETSVRRLSQRS
jgi:hypothetical protein